MAHKQRRGKSTCPPARAHRVIINAERLNAHLPNAIEAFFVLQIGQANRDGIGVEVHHGHQAFLRKYGLTEDEVPLLKLNPHDWEAPFSLAGALPSWIK